MPHPRPFSSLRQCVRERESRERERESRERDSCVYSTGGVCGVFETGKCGPRTRESSGQVEVRGGCVCQQPHLSLGVLLEGGAVGLLLLPLAGQTLLLHWRGRQTGSTGIYCVYKYFMCGASLLYVCVCVFVLRLPSSRW